MSLRAISRLTFLNACSAVVSVLTSVVMAWLFGTSTPAQVYLAAATCLAIAQRLFMVGQFSDVFLPQYVKLRETEGGVKADRCFSALFNHVMLMLVGIGALIALFASGFARLIAPGFSAADQVQVGSLLRGMVPAMILLVANGHLQIVGNARGWYGRFEAYGLAGNFLGLLSFIVTAKWFGVWSLVLSQIVMQLTTLLGSIYYLHRQGYRHAWITHEPGFSVWQVSANVGLTAVYVLATQWYAIVFTAAITYLPGGVLAVYKYAENLYTRVGSLFMRPVGIVFFTDAAQLTQRAPTQLRERISHALYHYALMYLGVIGVLFPALRNLLGGLWGGPRYGAAEIHLTTIYAWCLFGFLIVDGVGITYRRLNIAMGDLRMQYYILTLVQIGSALLCPLIVRGLGVNGAPVVLGLNIIFFLLAGLGLLLLRRPVYFAWFPKYTWKLAVTGAGPLLAAWLLPHFVPWLNYSGNYSITGKVLELLKAAMMAGLGLAMLAGMATWLKVKEADAVWRWMREQLHALRPARTALKTP